MIARLLSWLLRYANAQGGGTARRQEFYELKDRLLRKYAKRAGEDIQHIVDECWGWYDGPCEGKYCTKCGGTGVFRQRWILLERWDFAGRIFHRPAGELGRREPAEVQIEGRIVHNNVSWRTSREALLWLTLLCDQGLFWRLMTGSKNCGWQWRPMLALNAVVYEVAHYARRLKPRHCSNCGNNFIRPFDKGYWFICQRCERRPRAVLAGAGEDDDLPF